MAANKPTKFQLDVQTRLANGKSVLLVAPTGLGKTFAVTGDLEDRFSRVIYAAPLRTLVGSIRDSIAAMSRNGHPLTPVIHHGDQQDSMLFSEEIVVTTYDQIVCGVPGLPLSLPLKSGHAVAGALLMSRLVLDEAHLAWAISDQAISILLGIIALRQRLNLQTVLLTATLPDAVTTFLAKELDMDLVIVGTGDLSDDEGYVLREKNRDVKLSPLAIKAKSGASQGDGKLDYTPLYAKLEDPSCKRIYFCNTVEQIQRTYDALIERGLDCKKVTVLHNRMPKSWRSDAERETKQRFGREAAEGDWLLITNQVAEAGLDISAPLVISDPAAVDTLIQRAGRCARWFRHGRTEGNFRVISVPIAHLKQLIGPYRENVVRATKETVPDGPFSWQHEQQWLNDAWGISVSSTGKLPNNVSEKQREQAMRARVESAFALNLFDRAAQLKSPGAIAKTFREILSVEVAVEDSSKNRDIQSLLDRGHRPETSSISLNQAYKLLSDARRKDTPVRTIRYDDGDLLVSPATFVGPSDVIIVPSHIAYLHRVKGLVLGDASSQQNENVLRSSEWFAEDYKAQWLPREGGNRQTLFDHSRAVMEGTFLRFSVGGSYRDSLINILKSLEPECDQQNLASIIAQLAALAAAFHDLGKADCRWQDKVRLIDPGCPDELIARTAKTNGRIGIPHTPPAYLATIKAAELAVNSVEAASQLIKAIALAAARHHSSLMNPAVAGYSFQPHQRTHEFVAKMLLEAGIQRHEQAATIVIDAAKSQPTADSIPLMFPNDDLFPIYALVGRAILMADRENASGKELEQWRSA